MASPKLTKEMTSSDKAKPILVKTINGGGGSGGTTDYNDLYYKPKINGVELKGNKTSAQLGINIPDVSEFVTKNATDLVNYYDKTESNALLNDKVDKIDGKGLSTNDFTNQYMHKLDNIDTSVYATKEEIEGKADKTTTYTKEEVDSKIPDLTNYYEKSETDDLLLTKQETLESGVNIKTINNKSLLGEGNITIEGGTGSSVLTADLIVSNPMGKYNKDDKIDEGTELETIFRGILSKTYYPTLTDPTCTISGITPALLEVGTTLTSRTLAVNLNRGSINPQYTADSPYRSGEATKYYMYTTGADENYDSNNTIGSFTLPNLTRATTGSIVITGKVDYAGGCQPKDSDGNNYGSPLAAGSKSTTKTVEFIKAFFYGASATTDITETTNLTKDLSKKGNKTYYFNANVEHLVLIYDSSYGDLRSIIDANNFDLIDGWTKTTKTIEGQSYNVWTSNRKNTDTNIKLTFNF